MTKVNTKSNNLSKKKSNVETDDEDSKSLYDKSIADTDIDSELDPTDHDVSFRIQSNQSSVLIDLHKFLDDPKMINEKGNPTTNVVDVMRGKCYNIPIPKIARFFKFVENCRRSKIRLMISERQMDICGIMLDFDIYQNAENDQLTNEIFHVLCQKIISVLKEMLDFKEKKEIIYIGITRRPKITYSDEKECYKDGFHLIIPSIKVDKGVRILLINKLIENELIDQILSDVEPADIKIKGNTYTRNDFLDRNSSHVPVFLIGSSTKKGSSPYKLTHVFKATINTDNDNIYITNDDVIFKDKNTNICHEFSIQYEAHNGHIKKKEYAVKEKYITEIGKFVNKVQTQDNDLVKNYGELSINSVHDAKTKEIRELLDILHIRRADDYTEWRKVLCALANTSISYKCLAEYFSRKSQKFNMAGFEKMWVSCINPSSIKKNPLTLGTIHYWAKLDNPDRYAEYRNGTVTSILSNMVYENYKEGQLSNADIAFICHRLLSHKYTTDFPEGEKKRVWYEFILEEDQHIDGELYKWRRWQGTPTSLSIYISETLPTLFKHILNGIKQKYEASSDGLSKYFKLVLQNFKTTMRKLGDNAFKRHTMAEMEDKFYQCGFSMKLDQDPLVRGVQNGVLKLSLAVSGYPILIQGYHTHLVSRYTTSPYIPFNPYDPITKKILITLRNLFPDNEIDSFEFTMYYLAATIDNHPKESMFMICVGTGSNGKSFLIELHKAAVGATYCVKLPLSYLTNRASNAENATPALMMTKDASLVYYSESNKHERLNAAKVKELTGLETLSGRKLQSDQINFKPRFLNIACTNFDFEMDSDDYGLWRRVERNTFKITFIDPSVQKLDPNNTYQRIADPSITKEWADDPEVQGRYYGYMVWMHYWLYRRHRGQLKSIPHPHINYETEKYRRRQNAVAAFLAQRLVKCPDKEGVDEAGNTVKIPSSVPITDEIQKYIKWYQLNHGGILPAKGLTELFQNSQIGKFIISRKRGLVLTGHRFLDNNEALGEGEEYAMRDVFELELPPDNFGIAAETTEDWYNRLCREYDAVKHIFNNEQDNDIDVSSILMQNKHNTNDTVFTPKYQPRGDNVDETTGRILPSGIILKALSEEPSINMLTGEFGDLSGFFPAYDSGEDESDATEVEKTDTEDALATDTEEDALATDTEYINVNDLI